MVKVKEFRVVYDGEHMSDGRLTRKEMIDHIFSMTVECIVHKKQVEEVFKEHFEGEST